MAKEFFNTQLKFLPKNGCGPATPLRVAKPFLGIFFFFVEYKLHDDDTKGILISN